MRHHLRASFASLFALGIVAACGARSELIVGGGPGGGVGGTGGAGASSGTGGAVGGGGQGGEGGAITCLPDETMPCGSDVGECEMGLRFCDEDTGLFGPCEGAIEPIDEECNALDDDCDGTIDNGFGLGSACDGPDSDLCADDEMTCDGCSLGPDNDETCNGIDDNCNGTIDADCDYGACSPSLLVTGSTPSSPNCINFPVEAGSSGTINYPCTGGAVTANLDSINFTGSVSAGGQLMLTGTQYLTGPDNCQWQMDHQIDGYLPSGTINYSYWETLLDNFPWCWQPCTEVGTVAVTW